MERNTLQMCYAADMPYTSLRYNIHTKNDIRIQGIFNPTTISVTIIS